MNGQSWSRTDEQGNTVTVVATPSRVIGSEQVFEITEDALAGLMSAAGFRRTDDEGES